MISTRKFNHLAAIGFLATSLMAVTAITHASGADEAKVGEEEADGPIEGHLDEVNVRMIKGWVWDKTKPTERLKVDVLDGETLLTTVTATGFRADLKEESIGDGKHAFQLATPATLKDGKPHEIHARVAGTKTELGESPQDLDTEEAPASSAAVPPAGAAPSDDAAPADPAETMEGHLDTADDKGIAGWIWNKVNPDEKVKVDLFDGDTLLGTVVAGILRPDLKMAGIGDGKHAFRFVPPAKLKDGKPHAIHARVAGTTVELIQSPQTATF